MTRIHQQNAVGGMRRRDRMIRMAKHAAAGVKFDRKADVAGVRKRRAWEVVWEIGDLKDEEAGDENHGCWDLGVMKGK